MYLLDRFEGDFAIIEYEDENGTVSVIKEPRVKISADVQEGTVLKFEFGKYTVDAELTDLRRKMIREKLKRLLSSEE